MPAQDIRSDIDSLLAVERRCLLDGDFEGLERLLDHKEALVGELSALLEGGHSDLGALRERLSSNQGLLESASAGLRDVAARLGEMKEVQDRLKTYDARGLRQDVAVSGRRRLERRA